MGRTIKALAIMLGMVGMSAPGFAQDADPDQHPAEYFQQASEAFQAGDTTQATFLLYVGQLRYRAYLQANPDLEPSGDPALFGSLMDVVGQPINEYAFGDVKEAAGIIDKALAWDEANPDADIPDDIRASNRAGLIGLRDQMLANVEQIREQRLANGLQNR